MNFLRDAAIFLGAAVTAVPLFKKLGLGAVLGYLAAGTLIGPWGLKFITDVESILHVSELGVVLLLFLIGLELQPSRLWVLRRSVFGLGGAQVLVTGGVLGGIGVALGLSVSAAIIAGVGLSLSSTALVLQILAEKNQLTTKHGRSSFAILLFQDLAVIPLLAVVPLLGVSEAGASEGSSWVAVAKVVGTLVGVVLGGRYLLRPVFKAAAKSGSHEIFTAAALLVVIGTALLVSAVGLSMSLGAFLAGVLLADSEYRHELEANIEPFKGLLLGLFFIAVGMSANIGLLRDQALLVVGLTLGLMAVKGGVLFALGRLSRHSAESSRNLAFALPQGGEFAFVLFGVAASYKIMDARVVDLLVVVVTLSMALTPLFFALNDVVLHRWLDKEKERAFDAIDEGEHPVIIAGFGRFGQIVARILRVKKIGFTALEVSPTQVDFLRKFGNKIYYGDASRLDLLRAAKADKAKVLVLAIDDIEASVRTAETVKKHFPNLAIYARVRNRFHAYQMMDLGVTYLIRENYVSSLEMAGRVLAEVGLSEAAAARTIEKFRGHDEKTLLLQHSVHRDEAKLIQTAKEAVKELEGLFEGDEDAPVPEANGHRSEPA
jgi:monovalent cation:proton antiporter-2 (CPA2) family protein